MMYDNITILKVAEGLFSCINDYSLHHITLFPSPLLPHQLLQ